MPQPSAFDLLHDGIKRQLWRMKWTELKPLQVDAIRRILSSNEHVILSAGTAAGKTEAAFLPVLSAIANEPGGSVRAIYVGPLKALINDQFRRVEDLCSHVEIPVHRWHGDVGAAAKSKLVKQPSGVLLITPESLESLFVNRSHALTRLFNGLRFVVIDELHAFLDNERGLHLRSLLHRMTRLSATPPRLIGLSATIGDPQVAIDYVDIADDASVKLIVGDPSETELRLKVHAYIEAGAGETSAGNESGDDPVLEEEPPSDTQKMGEDIVRHCKGQSNLVFANSRNDVEIFGELAGRMALAQSLPDRFLVHHGSLSAEIRVDAEAVMKETSQSGLPATTFCSSTLEMGIDIGSVAMVGQIGPPYSVAALKQRVGRSGRRGGAPRILRVYLRCSDTDEKSDFFDRLQLGLIQTIATTELLIGKWVEPAEAPLFDFSTLTQQVISVIAETGGSTAADLYQRLCATGTFREIGERHFAILLRQLGTKDVIEQMSDGSLILGLGGERIRQHKGFYAAFMTADAFAVIHDGQKIGSVEESIPPGQHMILAGRRWKVVDLDADQMVIYVTPARGFRSTPFAGEGGGLHPHVVETMRCVLNGEQQIGYLDSTGATLLNRARTAAQVASACQRRLVELGPRRTAIMSWGGSAHHSVLRAVLSRNGLECTDEVAGLSTYAPIDEVRRVLDECAANWPTVDELAEHYQIKTRRKYDTLFNPELIWMSHQPSPGDVAGAVELCAQVLQAKS